MKLLSDSLPAQATLPIHGTDGDILPVHRSF